MALASGRQGFLTTSQAHAKLTVAMPPTLMATTHTQHLWRLAMSYATSDVISLPRLPVMVQRLTDIAR